MEHITPQYKRGKYINRKNRKKRIAIVCLCVAIVLAAAALLFFFRDEIFHREESALTNASSASQSSDTTNVKSSESGSGAQTVTESAEPISGTALTLADGKLLLTYDEDALRLTQTAELVTLSEKASDAETPRMDLQRLPTKLSMLRDSEKERIAIALLQAYYYHPPQTAEVTITVTLNEKNEYAATLLAPAIDDAPAAVCSVRLLAVGDELWAAVLLLPEGADSAALTNAFQWLNPIEENG